MTLVHAMVAGGDTIDDVDLLRSGSTAAVLGHQVMAPSTCGTFLRSFTFGHVRQLDRLAEAVLTRAWAAGAGPGAACLNGSRGGGRAGPTWSWPSSAGLASAWFS
jgi:hypothetical protein